MARMDRFTFSGSNAGACGTIFESVLDVDDDVMVPDLGDAAMLPAAAEFTPFALF